MIQKLIVDRNAPLDEYDTATETHGCRHTNPDICGNNGLSAICAFVTKNQICKKPPRSWAAQFKALKEAKK
jgi:hypothetical protein